MVIGRKKASPKPLKVNKCRVRLMSVEFVFEQT